MNADNQNQALYKEMHDKMTFEVQRLSQLKPVSSCKITMAKDAHDALLRINNAAQLRVDGWVVEADSSLIDAFYTIDISYDKDTSINVYANRTVDAAQI